MNKPPRPNGVAPRFSCEAPQQRPGGLRKINVNVGSPIKRAIDGVVWWSEERAFGGWRGLCRAVNRHRRQQRRFRRMQKKLKMREYQVWLEQQKREIRWMKSEQVI
jgi:hypothetical protein